MEIIPNIPAWQIISFMLGALLALDMFVTGGGPRKRSAKRSRRKPYYRSRRY